MTPAKSNRFTAVERSVIAALRRTHRNYLRVGRRSGNWTRAIKNSVGRVAKRYRSRAYAAQCAFEKNGEWVFDLIWSQEDDNYLYRLPLAMESEWYARDILWDFSKLVAARADHRLMIFWGKSIDDARATLDRMLKQVRYFRGTEVGDRYLFCYWTNQPDRFWQELYVVKGQSNYRTQRRARGSGKARTRRSRTRAAA